MVIEEKGPVYVTATITGAHDEVRAQTEEYLKRFHPAGYSTEYTEPRYLGGDIWESRIRRYASAD
jgi:hypothetical protein